MSIIENTLSKTAFFARNSRNLPLKHTWRKDQYFNQGSATHTSRSNHVSASPFFGLSPPCLFHTLHGLCLVFRYTCFAHFLWSLSIPADRWRHKIFKQMVCNCLSFTYSPEYFSLAASRPTSGPGSEALISPCHSRGLYLREFLVAYKTLWRNLRPDSPLKRVSRAFASVIAVMPITESVASKGLIRMMAPRVVSARLLSKWTA